jgi:hypothetical protein
MQPYLSAIYFLSPSIANQRMALNPRFSGHRVGKPGGHTVELYLDYVCPWSKIMFDKLYSVQSVLSGVLTVVCPPNARERSPEH